MKESGSKVVVATQYFKFLVNILMLLCCIVVWGGGWGGVGWGGRWEALTVMKFHVKSIIDVAKK